MRRGPRFGACALAALAALQTGCVGGGRRPPEPGPGRVVVGVYRGAFQDPSGEIGRFRVLLWAESPDRLHAEIVPPFGGPAWILDAGEGRIALAEVATRTAWEGATSSSTFESWIGVPIAPADFVRAVTEGLASSAALSVRRDPERGPGLPMRLDLEGGGARLRLERRGFTTAPRGELGRATVPAGFVRRPLEEIEGRAFR